MALHRDIHWIGRQWAVTGYGMQVIDQKHGGKFDVEIARVWDDNLLDNFSAQKWFNLDDFSRGLAIARKRVPAPPRTPEPEPAPAPPRPAAPLEASGVIAPPPPSVVVEEPKAPKAEPVKPAQALPPEDLLGKWYETYGLDNTAPAAPVRTPEPAREAIQPAPAAKLPEPIEPVSSIEQTATPDMPIEPVEPPKAASPILHMPIPGRARFVRAWRVQIRAVQSYGLRDGVE